MRDNSLVTNLGRNKEVFFKQEGKYQCKSSWKEIIKYIQIVSRGIQQDSKS